MMKLVTSPIGGTSTQYKLSRIKRNASSTNTMSSPCQIQTVTRCMSTVGLLWEKTSPTPEV